MTTRNLTEIKRRKVSEMVAGLNADNPTTSREAASRIIREAKEFGLPLKDFLTLAILPEGGENDTRQFQGLNGFEAALSALNLPFRNDFAQGVVLQAASDTFQKYPGTRLMFPEVIDQMLRWKSRQESIERIEPLIAQSRTITGSEMISTAVEDDTKERGSFTIGEMSRIPVRTIRTSQTSVAIYKHGSGIKTSYEFERRASLDILTPFAARVSRELEKSKVSVATSMLINGDGVNGAAPVVSMTSVGGTPVNGTTSKLRTQYGAVATWLINAAAAGAPIDTIVGNLAMYLELLFMFTPNLPSNVAEAAAVAQNGGPSINVNIPLLGGAVNFALSTTAPANKLIGFTKAETLEELVEAGSQISENERSIETQTVTYVKTENSGFKLAFADTRSVFDAAA